jgi:hypothetical protein
MSVLTSPTTRRGASTAARVDAAFASVRTDISVGQLASLRIAV